MFPSARSTNTSTEAIPLHCRSFLQHRPRAQPPHPALRERAAQVYVDRFVPRDRETSHVPRLTPGFCEAASCSLFLMCYLWLLLGPSASRDDLVVTPVTSCEKEEVCSSAECSGKINASEKSFLPKIPNRKTRCEAQVQYLLFTQKQEMNLMPNKAAEHISVFSARIDPDSMLNTSQFLLRFRFSSTSASTRRTAKKRTTASHKMKTSPTSTSAERWQCCWYGTISYSSLFIQSTECVSLSFIMFDVVFVARSQNKITAGGGGGGGGGTEQLSELHLCGGLGWALLRSVTVTLSQSHFVLVLSETNTNKMRRLYKHGSTIY